MSASSLTDPYGGSLRSIQRLSPHDAVRVRAAHRIPTFPVAVDGVCEMLRGFATACGARPVRQLHISAAPSVLSFTVDLTADIAGNPAGRASSGGGDWLRSLAALSGAVQLRLSVTPPAKALWDTMWTPRRPAPDDDAVAAGICDRIFGDKTAGRGRAVRLRCEVEDLFAFLPVRRGMARGVRDSGTSYRARGESRALVAAAYRVAVMHVIAPLYFLTSTETEAVCEASVSICLHASHGKAKGDDSTARMRCVRTAPALKEAITETPAIRNKPSATNGHVPRGLRTVSRLLSVFLEWTPPVREVFVKQGRCAVIFASTSPLGAGDVLVSQAIVLARHRSASVRDWYIVDESHRVHRHTAQLLATTQQQHRERPLIVLFADDTLLESSDATLRQCMLAAVRGFDSEGPAAAENKKAAAPLCAVGSLLSVPAVSREARERSGVALRVSLLTQRLCGSGGPRRTPFCPLKWGVHACAASSLARVRDVMGVAVDPARIVPRGCDAPETFASGACPFRPAHVIAQWQQKFLLLHTGGPALHVADQHAIHERLRLEYFLANAESYVQQRGATAAFPVRVPAEIAGDVAVFERVLARWGWGFSRGADGIRVAQWPQLLLEGHELRLESLESLHAMVEELLTVCSPSVDGPNAGEEAAAGGARLVPSAVLRFLVTRSCRGAVMFGDRLTELQVKQLVGALQGVHQYYLCSHGRPALASLSRHF